MSSGFIVEPERRTLVVASKDVVVVGGGPAGLAATIAAARHGVSTMLIERYAFLGGTATAGMVGTFFAFLSGERQVIRGIPQEVVDRLVAAGASVGHTLRPLGPNAIDFEGVDFDPELLKCVADSLVLEAGVEVLFHSWMVEVLKKKAACQGVIVESKSGRQAILGKVIIDATGDGDVAAKAGVPFEKGDAEDLQLQPMTLMFRMSNVDLEVLQGIPQEERNRIVGEGLARKELFLYKLAVTPLTMYPSGEVLLNMTRIPGLDGTKAEDVTRAEVEGRRQVLSVVNFLNKNMPGFKNAVLSSIAPQVGVRETRRIRGEYILSREDVLMGKQFDDAIAQTVYPIDLHDPKSTRVDLQFLPQGASCGIPYRCLLPLGVEGLLVAGRCVSSTKEANGAIRVMAPSMAMGQAAGTAAALAVKEGILPRRISVELLRKTLEEDGAVL